MNTRQLCDKAHSNIVTKTICLLLIFMNSNSDHLSAYFYHSHSTLIISDSAPMLYLRLESD